MLLTDGAHPVSQTHASLTNYYGINNYSKISTAKKKGIMDKE